MRIKTDMKKLRDAEARFVSIVRRGANGMGFRIQKEAGDDMALDLSAPTRIMKGERKPKTARVGAVIIKKSGDLPKMKEIIKKAGFDVDKVTEKEDGSVVFGQTEKPEEGMAVRMSENCVLVMKDYQPWCADITTFNDQLGANGYMDGLYSGCSALRDILSKIVWASESHDDMVAAAEQALSDFGAYAIGLMRAIPQACYQMDADFAKVVKSTTYPLKDALAPISTPGPLATPVAGATAGSGIEPAISKKETTPPAAEAAPKESVMAENKTEAQKTAAIPSADVGNDTLSANNTAGQALTAAKGGESGGGNGSATPGPATIAENVGVPSAGPGKTVSLSGTGAGLPDAGGLTVQKMQEMFEGMLTKVTKSFEEKIAGLEAQLKTTVQKSAEVEATLKGTVAAPAPVEKTAPAAKEIAKKDAENDILAGDGFYDSAFHGKVK